MMPPPTAKDRASRFRPGVSFRNGKIYRFEKNRVAVIRIWPPAAWTKKADGPWQRCRPELDLALSEIGLRVGEAMRLLEADYPRLLADVLQGQTFLPWYAMPDELTWVLRLQKERDAYKRHYGEIPKHIYDVVARFAERQFALLSLVYSCPDALDLVQSNPALGLMVATNWIWHRPAVKQPLRSARSLVLKKRREILRWLHFGIPSDAAVGVLAKYPRELMKVESLFYLRDAMQQPEIIRMLGFLPKINRGVVRIVSDPRLLPHASPRLLNEVAVNAEDDHAGTTAYWLGENLAMMERLERDSRQLRFHSIKRIQEVHQELSRDSIRIVAAAQNFPPPPLPGAAGIEPIETPDALICEAYEQNNCVMSLATEIAAGRLFLYRVVRPERATLSIAPNGNTWMIQECRGANNANVTPTCIAAVHEWLVTQKKESKQEIHNQI